MNAGRLRKILNEKCPDCGRNLQIRSLPRQRNDGAIIDVDYKGCIFCETMVELKDTNRRVPRRLADGDIK